jgi:signal transduction histidine kinase
VGLDRSDQVELLERLRATITDSLGRLRQLAFELRPPLLDEVGLGAAWSSTPSAPARWPGSASTSRTISTASSPSSSR